MGQWGIRAGEDVVCLESSARFDKRPVVAGLKCQPEEFGSDPRVKRKSVSSGLHW